MSRIRFVIGVLLVQQTGPVSAATPFAWSAGVTVATQGTVQAGTVDASAIAYKALAAVERDSVEIVARNG